MTIVLAVTLLTALPSNAVPADHAPGEQSDAVTVRAHSPTATYHESSQFRLVVTIRNHSKTSWLILPSGLRRTYVSRGGGDARYLPFPGPRLDPWQGAFVLAPGGSHSLEFSGLRDGDGIWSLAPREYGLTVKVAVPRELALSSRPASQPRHVKVWHGEAATEPLVIFYRL